MQAESLSFLIGFFLEVGWQGETDFTILGKNDFLGVEQFSGLARNKSTAHF